MLPVVWTEGSGEVLQAPAFGVDRWGQGLRPEGRSTPPAWVALLLLDTLLSVDPGKFHPLNWSFNQETPPAAAGRETGGGGVVLRGASNVGTSPGSDPSRCPGPSAVGRGQEPSCPARSGRWDVLIRPKAIFAARRSGRNPARLGRLRGLLGNSRRKVCAGRVGTRRSSYPGSWPGPQAQSQTPDLRPRAQDSESWISDPAQPSALGATSGPRGAEDRPRAERVQPRIPLGRPPRRVSPHTHRRRRGSWILGGAAAGREGARAESPPALPSARPGMPWSEGRARRGRARPEGAASLTQDSGMREGAPPNPCHHLEEGCRPAVEGPTGPPVAGAGITWEERLACEHRYEKRVRGGQHPRQRSQRAAHALPPDCAGAGLILDKAALPGLRSWQDVYRCVFRGPFRSGLPPWIATRPSHLMPARGGAQLFRKIRQKKQRLMAAQRSQSPSKEAGTLLHKKTHLGSPATVGPQRSIYFLSPQEFPARLGPEFFDQPGITLAQAFLGQVLVRRLDDGTELRGRIVETEAYLGPEDEAAHSRGGRQTTRNRGMFMKPGTLYVYIIYGMYFCLNVSSQGEGACVLLRALEPLGGLESMRQLRTTLGKGTSGRALKDRELCNGPSKLCQALAIDKTFDQRDLATDGAVWMEHGPPGPEPAVVAAARVGIGRAGEWTQKPLRFYMRGSPFVSVVDKTAEQMQT
ncbi:PREDICTED: uncharacterized protein LOC102847768 [Elephantulus edwardii]|uniref:uncharacterized protein LOC102847768 n=1 Tax=Elephantulus edwardii TaxID=28737 RepID=UPI0003F08420|nr:PREDICTED: uncharacterized protein LOC102847768 [Elephantulus edwardii]